MKLEKAIQILEQYGNYDNTVHFKDIKEATKLGSEALKRTQQEREHSLSFAGELLPGETED